MSYESRKAKAIDRYIKLEEQLKRNPSPTERKELMHELEALEILHDITTDDVLAKKQQVEKKETVDGASTTKN